MAQEAWYSVTREIFEVEGREFRKHPRENRWFILEEKNGEPYNAEIYELLPGASKIQKVTILGYKAANDEALSVELVKGERVARHEKMFDENFTVSEGHGEFRHRCFDGTVKTLRFRPDAPFNGFGARKREMTVYLSRTNETFNWEGDKVLGRILGGFKSNKNHNKGAAFLHLEQLIKLVEAAGTTSDLSAVEEKRTMQWRTSRKYYEYVRGSGLYFRKLSDDEIEEYDSDRKKRKIFNRSLIFPPQASLNHRKLRMYGFRNESETSF